MGIDKVSPIAGDYDCVYSLGMDCRPRHTLRKLDLKSRRGPFDWIAGRSVAALIEALETGCKKVFIKSNLEPFDIECKTYTKYWDPVAQFLSVHDFEPVNGDLDREYPVFKAKFDGICDRFFNHLKRSRRVLFFLSIGLEPSPDFEPESIAELKRLLPSLQRCLTKLCDGEATLLVASFHSELTAFSSPNIHIVTKREFPLSQSWMEGEELAHWREMLAGVRVAIDTSVSDQNLHYSAPSEREMLDNTAASLTELLV